MNRGRTFLAIAALALPLGLRTQAADQPAPPPAATPGRQAILNKLEHIRLDTLRYDGLPLGEVVLQLRDEALKRDPEKKGINFLINPNPPAAAPPVLGPDGQPLPIPPPESVDVSSIAIKIQPPLNDVRLVDALNAVVKVADRPIKYTIEDYGVVFSCRGSEPAVQYGADPACRQAISNKLERIRLDSVRYDGLPLGEVIVHLRDEARKRDPEKRGINFMIDPNPPAEVPSASAPTLGPNGHPLPSPPPETVDVSSIAIKIQPPLTDVRLVDALNAVVKVADRPIQYTVEDYGVVVSARSAEPPRQDEPAFEFPGGTPSQFLDAVQRQYKVDWTSVADIPPEMAVVRIPRLRISEGMLPPAGHPMGTTRGDAVAALVSLYNHLGEEKPSLGRLVVQGGLVKPAVVMFVPDRSAAALQPKIKVKAFSVYGINDAERTKLQEDIDRARKEAEAQALRLRGPSGPRSLEGTVAIHNDTSLLVATGPESFVDMVESIVNAFQAKERANPPGSPTALPNTPEK